MSGCYGKKEMKLMENNHYKDGKFVNEENPYKVELSKTLPIIWDMITKKSKRAEAKEGEVPVIPVFKQDLLDLEDNSVLRLGHSTLLFKLEDEFFITDPVFSERASPFSFMGPKRFHKSPIEIKDLPPIKGVLISHDHYDHLDEEGIKEIAPKVEKFYVPLKVSKHLLEFGVEKEKIVELDWWGSVKVDSFELIATPSQHFSGRWIVDTDKTLWCSWVIKTPNTKIFFGGDGGYFSGFKQIGDLYGPFDMTFLEVGAYNEKWQEIHMLPEESVQAHIDLRGKRFFPIHNGTFDLSLHSWFEPFDRVEKEAFNKDVAITFPKMGEAIPLKKEKVTTPWWR